MSEINELRFYPDGDYIIMFARRTPEMERKLKEFWERFSSPTLL